MNDKYFFLYYISALKEALLHAHETPDFSAKDPSWYYPESISKDLMLYEDSHYDEFPILEKVPYYFDAVSHNFPSIEGVDIKDYRQSIIEEMEQLEKRYLSNDECVKSNVKCRSR